MKQPLLKRTNIYVIKQKTGEQLANLIINFCISTLQLIYIYVYMYA